MHKIGQSGGFLSKLWGPWLKPGLSKSILTPLRLTAAATDVAIHNTIFGSGNTTLIISNEEMNDMISGKKGSKY